MQLCTVQRFQNCKKLQICRPAGQWWRRSTCPWRSSRPSTRRRPSIVDKLPARFEYFLLSFLQEVWNVIETFFVTSGFGGAPRPLLSLHIGQGGVVVTMLSENTKFLPTWRRSGLSYNQEEYFSTPECDVLRDLGSWHKTSPFYGTWSNLISLPLLGSSQMTITNLTLSQKLSWLMVSKVPVTMSTHMRGYCKYLREVTTT